MGWHLDEFSPVADGRGAVDGRGLRPRPAGVHRLGGPAGPRRPRGCRPPDPAPLPRVPGHAGPGTPHDRPPGVGAAPLLRLARPHRAPRPRPDRRPQRPQGRGAPAAGAPTRRAAGAARRSQPTRRRRRRPRRPVCPTARSSCATPRCSSCCTAAGSASPRRPASTSTRSTSPAPASWCGARAPSSARCRSASRRWPRSRRWLGDGRSALATAASPGGAVFLNRRGRRLTPRDARRILDRRAIEPTHPARAAPHVRHAPARRGR